MKKIKIFDVLKKRLGLFKRRFIKRKKRIREDDLDYEKNMTVLRRKLTVRIVCGILGTSVITLFIFTTISTRSIHTMLRESFEKELIEAREGMVEEVDEYYDGIEGLMKETVRRYGRTGSTEFFQDIEPSYLEEGIVEVALLDGSYRKIYHSEDRDLLPVKKEVKGLKFRVPFHALKMDIDEDVSYQHIYYKFFMPGGREHYLYFRLDNSALNHILEGTDYRADLLNDEFYVVSSNRELESTEYVINEISKKMLDGRQGMESFQGSLYSYSFIELGESSLYLQVYEDESSYMGPLIRYKSRIRLLWILAVTASITSVFFVKLSVESFSQGSSRISIEKEGDRRYKFLKRELVDIFDELEDIEGSLHKLRVFTDRLDLIRERILRQNKHSLEKMKREEEIIDRVARDEDLKERVKDRLDKR
jgi:hypothetical protein